MVVFSGVADAIPLVTWKNQKVVTTAIYAITSWPGNLTKIIKCGIGIVHIGGGIG